MINPIDHSHIHDHYWGLLDGHYGLQLFDLCCPCAKSFYWSCWWVSAQKYDAVFDMGTYLVGMNLIRIVKVSMCPIFALKTRCLEFPLSLIAVLIRRLSTSGWPYVWSYRISHVCGSGLQLSSMTLRDEVRHLGEAPWRSSVDPALPMLVNCYLRVCRYDLKRWLGQTNQSSKLDRLFSGPIRDRIREVSPRGALVWSGRGVVSDSIAVPGICCGWALRPSLRDCTRRLKYPTTGWDGNNSGWGVGAQLKRVTQSLQRLAGVVFMLASELSEVGLLAGMQSLNWIPLPRRCDSIGI